MNMMAHMINMTMNKQMKNEKMKIKNIKENKKNMNMIIRKKTDEIINMRTHMTCCNFEKMKTKTTTNIKQSQ